jgi:hypothetical protein
MPSTKKFVSNNFSVDVTALHAENSERFVQSAKPQATSGKQQASSAKLVKQRAASVKPRAASLKRQATSSKLSDS